MENDNWLMHQITLEKTGESQGSLFEGTKWILSSPSLSYTYQTIYKCKEKNNNKLIATVPFQM